MKNPSLGIIVYHHSASLVMPNGDPRDGFFLSYPHTHDRFLFAHQRNAICMAFRWWVDSDPLLYAYLEVGVGHIPPTPHSSDQPPSRRRMYSTGVSTRRMKLAQIPFSQSLASRIYAIFKLNLVAWSRT